ncbi:unnamed protein product [Trifolium pratense]|uniref:Uncharacterized protein n=1 Tax=Trifolium pratense TaxID=57577 RepID=A0ACB0JQV8_TRIPR|nr:unnamed protein product [Trifolium pratense]
MSSHSSYFSFFVLNKKTSKTLRDLSIMIMKRCVGTTDFSGVIQIDFAENKGSFLGNIDK